MRLWDRLSHRAGYWEGLASGAAVLTTSYSATPDREGPAGQANAWAQSAHANSAVVFSAVQVRRMVFSEAVFRLQAMDDKHLFGNQSLRILEEPWPDGSSGDLLGWMEPDGGLAGNAYIWRPPGEDRLVRLRPDWTTIVSELVTVDNGTGKPGWYRKKIGLWFEPPKNTLNPQSEGFFVPMEEVCHWAPIPDPVADFRGMSWLTPVMRDVQGDDGLTQYKIRYLQNAASPNLLIKYAQKLHPGTVDSVRERMTARYGGVNNAFKTLVLDQGADVTVIGNSLQQMDFSNVAAAGEQRILAASGVPGVLVGLEPLRGAGRGYQESIAKFANMTMRPLWRSACKALSKFVDDPSVQAGGSRLWFDTSDIAMLQDGEMERGQAALVRAQALLALVQAGYTHETAVASVDAMDLNLLKAGGVGTPAAANPVQHMLGQQQPGAVASPLPPTNPRLAVGSTSPGDGGNGTRPVPRPAAARRGANGHG